jgi:hypothetical protein
MTNVARTIEYTTNLDGWGAAPSDEEQASFCAYVVHRLEQTYPGSDVTAEIDEDALTSVVRSSDDSLDCDAIRSFVGNEIWSDWCGGARAPSGDDMVTIEEMPDHHRGSHRAARNWGVYPHNGATRRQVSRDEADEIVESDPDNYAHIVD